MSSKTSKRDFFDFNTIPFVRLAKLVNSESYVLSDRITAAETLRRRAKRETVGALWLATGNDDKRAVRKALKFYDYKQEKTK